MATEIMVEMDKPMTASPTVRRMVGILLRSQISFSISGGKSTRDSNQVVGKNVFGRRWRKIATSGTGCSLKLTWNLATTSAGSPDCGSIRNSVPWSALLGDNPEPT